MTETDKLMIFEQFIDRYSPSISSTIARLTGLTDKMELETISVNVLIDLWKNRDRLFNEIPPTAFIYKIVLQHVFTWLKQQNKEDHILLLQNTLPIDPAHYAHTLTSEKKTFNISHLVQKMKEMLK
jgi:DNA-directed RNA polymerase specialized sigma24 family protein